MDEDFDWRFGRDTHFFIGTQMKADLQDSKHEKAGGRH
jgi:hypothetical protein